MGKNRTCDSLLLQGGGFSATPFAKRMPAPIFILGVLGVLGGQFAFLYVDLRLRDLRVLTRSLPVDFAQLIRRISPTCSSFGAALRQSISTFPEGLDSPFGLPAAGFLSTFDYLALRAACGRQCWFAPPPGCLTLRAAYAAYRTTALLLGSQPAPAGMCSPLRYGCLVRSRSSRPTGCLRQATQPAPAGMCSRLRFQVSGFCFLPPPRSPRLRVSPLLLFCMCTSLRSVRSP